MDLYQDQQGCTAIWPDAEHQVSGSPAGFVEKWAYPISLI